VKTVKGLKNKYAEAPEKVCTYFQHFEALVDGFPLDVALSYVFAQVELAQNMTLYCGAVKVHRVNAEMARSAVDAHHLTRKEFREKVEVIYGKPIPDETVAKLEVAERVRDKVMHGKACSDADKRNALARVFEYAAELNSFLKKAGGSEPFGSLKGFKGRAKTLDRKTSRWVLKGMGFPV